MKNGKCENVFYPENNQERRFSGVKHQAAKQAAVGSGEVCLMWFC